MCSGDMYTDPELGGLWSLALRDVPLASLLRYVECWPISYRPASLA